MHAKMTNPRLFVSILLALGLLSAVIGLVVINRHGTGASAPRTYSSFDPPGSLAAREVVTGINLKFTNAEISAVFEAYQQLSGRTVIRGETLTASNITLQCERPLPRREALQLLDTVLAENGIAMVLLGDDFVKAVPARQAASEPGPVIDLPAEQLPESSSYMVRVVKLRHRDPTEVMVVVQPFSKLPNSIVAIKSSRTLILRDYSANIRRMLQMVDEVDRVELPKLQQLLTPHRQP